MAYRIASSFAAVCLSLALAPLAMADEPSASDKTLAQSLFDQGRALMDQGRYAEACPRFVDSERLDPGGGTVLNLALCQDKLGKLAQAYGTYNEAISLAISEHRRERETFARDRAAALAPRLPHLTLQLNGATTTTDVRLDGSKVPPSAWGTAMAVDPGEHSVEASDPNRLLWKKLVTLKEGESQNLPITLIAPAPEPEPPATGMVATQGVFATNVPHYVMRRSAAYYVLGGVSLVALGASAVTGGLAWSAHESVASKCSSQTNFCTDPTGISDASRARTMAWASTATLGGGILFGLIAFALPLHQKVIVGSTPGGASIALSGEWR